MSPERVESQTDYHNPRTVFELKRLLKKFGIPLEEWGNKAEFTKKPEDLLEEIERGESILCSQEEEGLKRYVKKVAVDIVYSNDGKLLRLYQIYSEKKGRIRRRGISEVNKKTFDGLMGKLLPEEDPDIAAERELEEEILKAVKDVSPPNLTEKERSQLTRPSPKIDERISNGFPGLLTEYTIYRFIFLLPDRFFRPEGYKTVDKNDFPIDLRWEPVIRT